VRTATHSQHISVEISKDKVTRERTGESEALGAVFAGWVTVQRLRTLAWIDYVDSYVSAPRTLTSFGSTRRSSALSEVLHMSLACLY
jgi:hypothetical protein